MLPESSSIGNRKIVVNRMRAAPVVKRPQPLRLIASSNAASKMKWN